MGGEQDRESKDPNHVSKGKSKGSVQDKGHAGSQWWMLENVYLTRGKLSSEHCVASSHKGVQKYKRTENRLDSLRKNVPKLLNYKGTIHSSAHS